MNKPIIESLELLLLNTQDLTITTENLHTALEDYSALVKPLSEKPTLQERVEHDKHTQIISSLQAVLPLIQLLQKVQDRSS